MALLAPKAIGLTGTVYGSGMAACTGGGDTFNAGNKTFLHVHNGDGSSHTVTVTETHLCDQGVEHDSVSTVAAGADVFIGPFPASKYGDGSGIASITYDAVTSMTIEVFQLADA